MTAPLLAGIEAGGTKFVCCVARAPDDIVESCIIPTASPEQTLRQVTAFFGAAQAKHGPISSLGVASFGPLDLDPGSPAYGTFTGTPKPGWSGFNLRRALVDGLRCPVTIDTDVAGAGIAEHAIGAGRGLDVFAYVTVGTGVGGALIVDGRPVHGAVHPEMGHMLVRRHFADADFPGVCPYHGDCLEGLASGVAVVARGGNRLSDIPATAPIWQALADYLAQFCATIMLVGAARRIIMGGGVMSNAHLYPMVRGRLLTLNNGYVRNLTTESEAAQFIAPPALGDQSGLIGALLLAQRGLGETTLGAVA